MAARLIGQTRHNTGGRYGFFTLVLLASLSFLKEVEKYELAGSLVSINAG
jgi:hypothetical protein